ncbi:MAG: alpha/beta hydrolase [Bdellovibrionaceae bacterium]|nr:alpha/beta hydrolase [Pseudobdellovibrionaceae bacterium]
MSILNQFHYQILGSASAPKLVFLHGLLGSGANWRKITPSFVGDFEILLLDQRGHGRSFQPAFGYNPEDYAQDLNNILQELGWSKVNLVGHSMGGRNALVFADLYPEKVRKLVIEDIGPNKNTESSDKIKKLINLVPVPFANRNEARDFFHSEFLELIQNQPHPELLSQYFYSNISENAQKQLDWRFSKPGVFATLDEGRIKERWSELERLNVPTLVIRGEKSDELSPDVFNRMMACNSWVQGVEIEDCGHWVHSEKPKEFIELVSKFLTS